MLVKMWTDNFVITGEIDTLRDERLTDYIRENKDFIAVTQVRVCDRNEKDLFRTHFLNVSTSHIELILPAESNLSCPPPSGHLLFIDKKGFPDQVGNDSPQSGMTKSFTIQSRFLRRGSDGRLHRAWPGRSRFQAALQK